MLIVCIFLASLCFSLLCQAIQTLVHIDQQDTMHLPLPVLILAVVGLLLNGLCYLLIGGYTFHQGSFLHISSSGDVVLDRVITTNSKTDVIDPGEARLNEIKPEKCIEATTNTNGDNRHLRFHDVCRDLCSKFICKKKYHIICTSKLFN